MNNTFLNVRNEFSSALNQVCSERHLEPEAVIGAIEAAILAAFRKDYGFEDEFVYKTEVNVNTGESKIYKAPRLEEDVEPKEGEVVPEPKFDDSKKEDITPPGFGRIASQVAKQVILQKIREAERSSVLDEYADKVGTLISGMILRYDRKFVTVDLGRGQAIMPVQEQIPGERYVLNKRLTFYVKEIRDTFRGKQIILSRADAQLVAKLFEREVPEVASKAVEIRSIAREAGGRTKLAVFSSQNGVDPVGSCVGQKGVRVQTVIDEVNNEKVDIIQYSDDPVKYIVAALAPAQNLEVTLNEEEQTAVVIVPEDQLSLAIGREGQNVRLAAKLTNYKIDIKGPGGSMTESEKKKMATSKEEDLEASAKDEEPKDEEIKTEEEKIDNDKAEKSEKKDEAKSEK